MDARRFRAKITKEPEIVSMKMFQEKQKMQLEQTASLLTGFKYLLKDLVKE